MSLRVVTLPQMNYLGGSVIDSAIKSAKQSIKYVEEQRNSIAITLLTVSILTIILGVVFGSLIARSITTAVSSFQGGLLNFFEYLNQKQKTAQPIIIQGNDEISVMAEVVNKNIVNIQSLLNRKTNYQNALLEWFKVDYLDDNITINKATELSAKALNVERVSIWLFNDDKTVLTCANLYLRDELSAKALNVERVSIWFLMTTKQF